MSAESWVNRRVRRLPDGAVSPEISVYAGAREHEGSCNGCQRRDNPTVFVVRLSSISIRVCADCARVVLAGLKTAVKNER